MPHSREMIRHHMHRVISNRLKLAKRVYISSAPHSFSKHKPLDCGVSRCPMCHPPLVQPKYKTDYLDQEIESVAFDTEQERLDAAWEQLYFREIHDASQDGSFSDIEPTPVPQVKDLYPHISFQGVFR
jgi:hypothetical protein